MGVGASGLLILLLLALLLLLTCRRWHRLRLQRMLARPFKNDMEDMADIELNEFAVSLMFFFLFYIT